MNNADYWAKRFKLMEDAIQDKVYDTYVKNLEKQYDAAIREIDTQLRAWYQRFAANNEISYSEARRWLTAAELDEFKWTVQEYIEKARESGFTGEWVKELENASARVHVSRLDAIKLQLKQHAEQLTQAKISSITDAAEFAYTQSYWHSAYEIQHGSGMGWTMQGIDKAKLEKVLSRPWTTDNQTFTARCWTDKARLVETVNQELTRMLATGAAPDKSIDAIAKLFNTSKNNAGKLVMTESAYFASAAQQECFEELEVEEYSIVGTLDKSMCDLCGGMDGRVFKMSEFKVGATAPPFHPWCRCTRAPYFADMDGVGRRFARDPDEGYTYTVPKDMTYKQWKTMQELHEDKTDNPITVITDKAIDRVPKMISNAYSDDECKIIQREHKELLKTALAENNSNEVAFIFNSGLTQKSVVYGTDDKLSLGMTYGKNLFVMHNHPRNNGFSLQDITEFVTNDCIKSMSVVKNNGAVEILTKTSECDILDMMTDLSRLLKKQVKQNTDAEYRKVINKFLDKYTEKGVVEWLT